MTCEQSGELLLDVLYGEEVPPRTSFQFFEHLAGCDACKKEYLELIETRELLAQWPAERDDSGVTADQWQGSKGRRHQSAAAGLWWTWIQRVAAGMVILLGTMAITQSFGLWGPSRTTVSEDQLTEMVHDLVVAKQVEDWKLIGTALLTLREDLDNQDRLVREAVYEDLQALEQRFIEVIEDASQHERRLLSQ
jgi:hypothetical protein